MIVILVLVKLLSIVSTRRMNHNKKIIDGNIKYVWYCRFIFVVVLVLVVVFVLLVVLVS